MAGRPLIALEGQLPVFRSLIPTLEGPDVRQLEAALNRLGYQPGDVDGVYTAATSAAVEQLYRDRGYSPPENDDTDEASLRAAREAVTIQEAAVADARRALDEAGGNLPESERLSLQQAVEGSEADLAAARTAADDANTAAAEAVADAQSALDDARAAADTAADRLADAEAGTHPDTGTAPTDAEMAELRAARDATAAAVDEAADALADAQLTETRTAEDQQRLIDEAEGALALNQAIRSERLAPPEAADLRTQLDSATTALADARADLADAEARAGAPVPATELVFLTALPREVQSLTVEVGDVPTGPVMTISGTETVIESGLSSADRRLVAVGDTATLAEDGLGLEAEAVVTFIADNPGGGELSADRYAMRLEPVDPLPDDAVNVNLRISIPITASDGEVLAVPLAALSAGPDGAARVEVERSPGETEVVEVATGLRAEGFVEVSAVDGDLEAGDRVVVGRDLDLPGAAGDEGDGEPGDDEESDP